MNAAPSDRPRGDQAWPLAALRSYTADAGTRSAEALSLLGTLAATSAAEKPAPAP